jgi:hypothetical protein
MPLFISFIDTVHTGVTLIHYRPVPLSICLTISIHIALLSVLRLLSHLHHTSLFPLVPVRPALLALSSLLPVGRARLMMHTTWLYFSHL